MTDSELIWKYLTRVVPDDHQAVYLYVIGKDRSAKTATDKILEVTTRVFSPSISLYCITAIVKGYLEEKKKRYMRGEFTPKSIY
jgi:hypothetical protein